MDLFYVVIVAALAVWVRRWWREVSVQKTATEEPSRPLKRRFALWLSLGMIGPACLLAPIIGPVFWQTVEPGRVQHLTNAEMQKIVTDRADAYYTVMTDEDGTKTAEVVLPENSPGSILWKTTHMPTWRQRWGAGGTKPDWWNLWTSDETPRSWIEFLYWTGWRPIKMLAADSESMIKLLEQKRIHYMAGSTRYFAREAWPFGSLLPFFIAPMGAALILLQIRTWRCTISTLGTSKIPEQETKHGRMLLALRTDPAAQRVFGMAFAMGFLLVFGANAFTTTKAFTAMGLYVVLFLGSVKGAFFGLIAGVGVLYFRTRGGVRPSKALKG